MLLHVDERDVASTVLRLHGDDVLLVINAGLQLNSVSVVRFVAVIMPIAAFASAGELVAIVFVMTLE